MKVIDKTKIKKTYFMYIKIGDVFKCKGDYYIKTSCGDQGNVLSLSENVITSFKAFDRVLLCKTELHIIEEGV